MLTEIIKDNQKRKEEVKKEQNKGKIGVWLGSMAMRILPPKINAVSVNQKSKVEIYAEKITVTAYNTLPSFVQAKYFRMVGMFGGQPAYYRLRPEYQPKV